MTAKEIFLELLKPDGKADRQLIQYEALNLWLFDPVNGYLMSGRGPGVTAKDLWGVTIAWPKDHPGQQPIVTEETKVLKDITHWRDYVTAPDVEANCQEGWEECAAKAREVTGNDRLFCAFSGTGLFEQCHFLMGFTDTLTNLYEHPTEMHELIDYICEYKLKILKLYCDKLQPDAVFFHDDWGAKDRLFMDPDMWRAFFKEPYRRIYGYLKDRGVIGIHHADSYLAPIVEDMAEIGIRCWQGVLPENDIPALQKRLNGSMILMGGIGAEIDTPTSTESEIRAYVSRILEQCCPSGHFIPSITYGLAGTIFPHVDPFIDDEIRKYNATLHMPKVTPVVPRRTVRTAPATVKTEETAETDIFAAISAALIKGQKKRTAALTEQALAEGKSATDILNKGLVSGMTKLGEDFSAGKAFVPEMLMAAKCMNEATALIKPRLQDSGVKAAGKAVLGTVKGDLHDIGKNVVKIMLEGAGIEVVDLGVDVSAEAFIQTAIEQKCDIIACSALLTTAMHEMENVVACAKEAGIRDQVYIMIGGAPASEAYCEKIGADCYTPDAAACARAAAEILLKK